MIEGPAEEAVLQTGETVMPKIEELRRDGVIAGYDLISRYLPSHRLQQQRQQSLPEPHVLRRNVETALKGLPFRRGLYSPLSSMRWRLHDLNRRPTGHYSREPHSE